ncbi:hypothetical protein F5Y09DRAFT_352946 [Xylaria sp. FL1042]|nr:hypothetical protein F5Y09DRAFT_352946 [Xylaria sp. FL1042]
MSDNCVPYLYEEFLSQARVPSVAVLKSLLPQLIQHFDDLRIVVDRIDEISVSFHQPLIKELLSLTGRHEAECRLLIVSQDFPSISSQLSRIPQLCLNEERDSIEKDISLIIYGRLREIDDMYQGALGADTILSLKNSILAKAEGMFLWVDLILELLSNASNMSELRMQIDNLPEDLVEAYKKILHNISNSCSSSNFSKIRRVFSWIMYCKGRHPLRKCQVRIAMILNPDCQIMTRETRPFPNATDICKPFIEDGPGGSLVFVHSSVPHGPFIQAPESHISLASACISQITQSLDLLDPGISEPALDQYASTVAGFYALLPYASEYWMDHLLDCLDGDQLEKISVQIKRLCQKLRQFSSLGSCSNDVLEAADSLDPRLTRILSREETLLISQCWLVKQREDLILDQHTQPQHLQQALKHYNEGVQFLMSQANVHGIPQQELLGFKKEFGSTAFVCDHRGCERVILGFSSKTALIDHQARHNGDLKCFVHGCAYNDVGFMTTKDLQAHCRKRHGAPGIKRVPKRFRQTDNNDASGSNSLHSLQWDYDTEESGSTSVDAESRLMSELAQQRRRQLAMTPQRAMSPIRATEDLLPSSSTDPKPKKSQNRKRPNESLTPAQYPQLAASRISPMQKLKHNKLQDTQMWSMLLEQQGWDMPLPPRCDMELASLGDLRKPYYYYD